MRRFGPENAAIRSNDEVVPASDLKAAQQKIRELERQFGRKTMEAEILKEVMVQPPQPRTLSKEFA